MIRRYFAPSTGTNRPVHRYRSRIRILMRDGVACCEEKVLALKVKEPALVMSVGLVGSLKR